MNVHDMAEAYSIGETQRYISVQNNLSVAIWIGEMRQRIMSYVLTPFRFVMSCTWSLKTSTVDMDIRRTSAFLLCQPCAEKSETFCCFNILLTLVHSYRHTVSCTRNHFYFLCKKCNHIRHIHCLPIPPAKRDI